MDTKKPFSFGGLKSEQDYRTLNPDSFAAIAGTVPANNKVDLNHPCTNELCDQQSLGICTQCATRMASENHFKDAVRLNEYWNYIIGKLMIEGNLSEGSSALTMLKSANKYGLVSSKVAAKYPLKTDGTYAQFIADLQKKYPNIPQEIMDDATKHKIPGYYAVPLTPTAVARELAAGRLVIVRFAVGENWYEDVKGNYTRKAKDLFPLRAPKNIESGHLVALTENQGLDLTSPFTGVNSWSTDWGDNGFFHFIWNQQVPQFLTEAWAIADAVPEVITLVKQLPAAKDFHYSFPKDMEYGQQNDEVKQLHIALSILGYMNVSLDEWGIYGSKTAAAVLAYQKVKKLQPVAQLNANKGHYVHSLTRAALAKDFK